MNVNRLYSNVTLASKLLKNLAHPDRLTILCQLVDGEQSVGELIQRTNLSQSAFSQHLAILRKAHLVKTRKQAQTVYYVLEDKNTMKILQALNEIYCHDN